MTKTQWISRFVLVILAGTSSCCFAQVERFRLANGVTIVVSPVPGAGQVGIESVYDVGFVDEPENMVQVSHLLEHLVCYSPGAGFEQKKAMEWLNSIGMANAETLPDWTHYDYAVPVDDIEKVFEIEAARLQQKSFAPRLIRAEAKRVYQETDFVENHPSSGMAKHAFMALAHHWKFNARTALVRGGLEQIEGSRLVAFYKQTYRPENLRLYVTGDITVDQARRFAEQHLGSVQPPAQPPGSSINWTRVPAESTIRWDSANSAMCVAWDPPESAEDRILLSAVSLLASQSLWQNAHVQERCHMIQTSNNTWPVGDLPLFVYAMAKPETSLDELSAIMVDEFEKALRGVAKRPARVKGLAFSYEFQMRPKAWDQVKNQAKRLRQQNRTEGESVQLILLQDALNRAIADRFLGDKPNEMIALLKQVDQPRLSALIETALERDKRHTTRIVPQQD